MPWLKTHQHKRNEALKQKLEVEATLRRKRVKSRKRPTNQVGKPEAGDLETTRQAFLEFRTSARVTGGRSLKGRRDTAVLAEGVTEV